MNNLYNILRSLSSADYDFLVNEVFSNLVDETCPSVCRGIQAEIAAIKLQIDTLHSKRDVLNFERSRLDGMIKSMEDNIKRDDIEGHMFICLLRDRCVALQDSIGELSPTKLAERKSKLKQKLDLLNARQSFIQILKDGVSPSKEISMSLIDKAADNIGK